MDRGGRGRRLSAPDGEGHELSAPGVPSVSGRVMDGQGRRPSTRGVPSVRLPVTRYAGRVAV